jgi:hypothetical protein
MEIDEIFFTDETESRVAVKFTEGGLTRSGNWRWPVSEEKQEAVDAFLAAQDPPLAKPEQQPEPQSAGGTPEGGGRALDDRKKTDTKRAAINLARDGDMVGAVEKLTEIL